MQVLAGIHDPATIYTHNGENKMIINELTPERLEVTPEQLLRCVRKAPLDALKYYSEEELAGKLLEYYKELTNDR